MNDTAQDIVSVEFLLDTFISRNGRMPKDVDEFEEWLETIDVNTLTTAYFPGWEVATQARDIIDKDEAEHAKYTEFIFSIAIQGD